MSILNVEHLTHGFGDRAIFSDVSFRLLKGEHIGLVGANGEGKSTFMNILTGTAQVGMPLQTAYLLKQSSITQQIATTIKLCCCSTTQVLKLLQLKLCPPSLKTIKVVVMYLKRSVMIHPYSIMESITKSANCWLFLYKKIEGINPRLLLCSTLIDLASIQYFLQPDLHSSQQLLCSYVKV